ncbi:NEW3 domain-containing protein [Kribbella catacumbae]|uniref:NEW3 domain-containing protein n=1 Tax=Kribbella catacumbae TaxID=460086 RepID=UPI000381FDA7|nr:NEW3 domain-containing protein [Kribbella catacumbae]
MKKLAVVVALTAALLVPQVPAAAAEPVEVTISEVDLAGPVIASVDVTVTNKSAARLSKLAVTFAGPVGWTVYPETRTVKDAVKPGESVTVAFQIRVPEQRPGFTIRTFTATAAYSGGEVVGTRTQKSGTPLPNLAAAFNNVAVSNESDPTKGNFDNSGNSFSAQRLAEKDVTPGSTVTALGATFTWPGPVGTKDNAVAAGQTFAYSGKGAKLALLGSGAGYAAAGLVKVWYSDGTSTSGSIGFPNWSFQDAGAHGATLVISTTGRNTPAGYANAEYQYRVFANSIPLDPAKTVELITLPANGGLHVFGVAIA